MAPHVSAGCCWRSYSEGISKSFDAVNAFGKHRREMGVLTSDAVIFLYMALCVLTSGLVGFVLDKALLLWSEGPF